MSGATLGELLDLAEDEFGRGRRELDRRPEDGEWRCTAVEVLRGVQALVRLGRHARPPALTDHAPGFADPDPSWRAAGERVFGRLRWLEGAASSGLARLDTASWPPTRASSHFRLGRTALGAAADLVAVHRSDDVVGDVRTMLESPAGRRGILAALGGQADAMWPAVLGLANARPTRLHSRIESSLTRTLDGLRDLVDVTTVPQASGVPAKAAFLRAVSVREVPPGPPRAGEPRQLLLAGLVAGGEGLHRLAASVASRRDAVHGPIDLRDVASSFAWTHGALALGVETLAEGCSHLVPASRAAVAEPALNHAVDRLKDASRAWSAARRELLAFGQTQPPSDASQRGQHMVIRAIRLVHDDPTWSPGQAQPTGLRPLRELAPSSAAAGDLLDGVERLCSQAALVAGAHGSVLQRLDKRGQLVVPTRQARQSPDEATFVIRDGSPVAKAMEAMRDAGRASRSASASLRLLPGFVTDEASRRRFAAYDLAERRLPVPELSAVDVRSRGADFPSP